MTSTTENLLIELRNAALDTFPGMDRKTASKLALAGAAASLQAKGAMEAAGYRCKIDKDELLSVLDRIIAQGTR